MATVTRTRTATTTFEHDDSRFPPRDFERSFQMIGAGMRDMARSTTEILLEFQGAVKIILPSLSEDHQNQIYETFSQYHTLLVASQRFLTRSLILAARARTSNELVTSININAIQEMCSTVQMLVEHFLKLNPILEEKLRDQRTLKLWRNILGLAAAIGSCALLVGLGFGFFARLGFTKPLKVFQIATGSITVAAGAPAVFAHVTQHVSELNHITMVLKDIRNGLTQLSQNYPKLEEMVPILSDEDNTKRDFIQLLKETQLEVNKGFELLKQL